jgi:putative effector of murein hydrolase
VELFFGFFYLNMLDVSPFSRKLGEFTNDVFNSIALLPMLITLLFIAMALGMMHFDYTPYARSLINMLPWIQFKEMETGRTILST